MRSAGQPEYDNAVRVLTSVQVAEYVDNISLAGFDEIEVTSAALAHVTNATIQAFNEGNVEDYE